MNTTPYDLAVVGAGPAGMAAAIESARLGLNVVVIDEQPHPGGQIYRQVGQPVLQEFPCLAEVREVSRALPLCWLESPR